MSQELTTTADGAIVLAAEERIDALMDKAEAYLEPIGISPQFFRQCAITAQINNSHLRNADRESFDAAVLKCAQRGLLPDGESAVLVSFKGNVTLIPMVGGMLDMVRRNIPGCAIESRVVREWDDFEIVEGTHPLLRHVPNPLPHGRDPRCLTDIQTITGAWCIVTMPPLVTGAEPVKEHHHMWRHEIEQVRSRVYSSRTPSSPWTQHPHRMYEKTVIRACLRRLPSRHQIFAHFDATACDDFTRETVKAEVVPVAALMPPKPTKI